ncbi:MAG TPA: nitroreductase [Clostridiales bacterium UBA8153]|nr:nitroreductase [Clostridiales bacterium UBA8153]
MDIFEAIKNRRSIRRYRTDPVPPEVLGQVLEAGRVAPSAANRQAWKFVVVTDAAIRQELVPACRSQQFVGQAPVVIAACATEAGRKWNQVDLAIAVDHMTLAAHGLGLGTCWIGAFEEEAVRGILGIPEGVSVVVLLTLGYADGPGRPPSRKELGEVVCYQRYS